MSPPLVHKTWQRIPEFHCDENKENCFQKSAILLQQVAERLSECDGGCDYWSYMLSFEANKYNLGDNHSYSLESKKTPFVFVIVHGLYGNSYQFVKLAYRLKALGQNVVVLTLPGHGFDYARAQQINYKDWEVELNRAVRLARPLGEKLVLFGQSTGGVLSLKQTLTTPDLISGLMMLEPALKVQSSIETAACVGKSFFTNAQSATIIANMLGMKLPERPINVQMGCQVGEIFRSIEDGDNLQSLVQKMNVPTLMISNKNDHVVENDINNTLGRILTAENKGLHYEIDEKGILHGVFQFYRPKELNEMVLSYLNAFHDFLNTRRQAYAKEQEKIAKVKYMTKFFDRFRYGLTIELMYLDKSNYFSASDLKRVSQYYIETDKLPSFADCSDVLGAEVCTEFLIDREELLLISQELQKKIQQSYDLYPEIKSLSGVDLYKFYKNLEKKNPGGAKIMAEAKTLFLNINKFNFAPFSKQAESAFYIVYGKLENPDEKK